MSISIARKCNSIFSFVKLCYQVFIFNLLLYEINFKKAFIDKMEFAAMI
ncbi:MAG: hypothetical protein JWN76_1596 [Chitinophagaceae bacterium]|nr:hypothetical protein [Chitinophagaceae bacterium]